VRVLVCGGRDYQDRKRLFAFLDALDPPASVIIEGEALGADQLSALWPSSRGVKLMPFPADWSRHGKSAGPIRNRQMLIEGRPDIVVAFPGGKGTANMIKQAVEAGVKVELVV